jgi:pimeloyl-ACP methyl ester carboxylesterase
MDLPYHGETEWREQHPFGKQDLEQIIRYWQKTTGTRTFSMLGFSMGGKCAMAALSMFPGQTENLFLLASDGIQTKRVFNVAVYPRWGRRLFKSTIKRPGWFFIFIRTMHQIGILSSWLLRFAMNHMDTMAKRQRLYDTWLSMADFTIDIDKFRQTIHTHQIPLHLIFGQRDEVIPPSVAKFLAKGLPSASVEIIDRGHYFIDEQLNAVLDKYMA